MRPMLDDLALPQVQILRLHDRRRLAEHRAPTMDGSYLQNLGRSAGAIAVAGVASGPTAQAFLEALSAKFDAGVPVSFVSDIVADAEIEAVLIDDFKVRDLAGKPERYAYALVLHEHREPAEPEDLSALQDDLLGDAGDLIDDLVEGLDLSLDFTTGLERFVGPLTEMLGRLQALNRGNGG